MILFLAFLFLFLTFKYFASSGMFMSHRLWLRGFGYVYRLWIMLFLRSTFKTFCNVKLLVGNQDLCFLHCETLSFANFTACASYSIIDQSKVCQSPFQIAPVVFSLLPSIMNASRGWCSLCLARECVAYEV
jgi:hypothetical protein